jgi:hypothetical protein
MQQTIASNKKQRRSRFITDHPIDLVKKTAWRGRNQIPITDCHLAGFAALREFFVSRKGRATGLSPVPGRLAKI